MKVLFGLVLLAALIPAESQAHSQLFLRAQARVIIAPSGNLTKIRNDWHFEPISAAAIVKAFDHDRNGRLEDGERSDIAAAVRTGQPPFTAETHLVRGGRHLPMSLPSAVRVHLVGKRLIVSFIVKPRETVRAAGRLAFWLDDPKNNGIIDFEHDADLAASGSALHHCRQSVVRPGSNAPSTRSQTLATDMFFSDPASRTRPALIATRLELDCRN